MFLGIDLGTSQVKVLLLDARHGFVASTAAALSIQRPHSGWSEQQPQEWWAATDRAVTQLAAEWPREMSCVQAIGLSGQMHGAVLLDAADRIIRPAILWNDGRSAAQCVALEASVPRLREIAGNMAMPGFTAPKLLWVRDNEPELFGRIATVLLPKDWLRLKMSNEKVSDMSDASGTLWLDVAARAWSPALLHACGLTPAHMPRLVEGTESAGQLRADIASRWGLRAGIPIAGGGGDNAASAVGIGAVRPGEGFISLGTSGVIFLCSEGYHPRAAHAVHTYCHALPQAWHQMSVMLSAASALRWAAKLTGAESEAALLKRVALLDGPARRRAPLFLPYLDGERTPYNDAAARGVLFGLDASHDAGSVGYAVIEGVSFGLLDGWNALGGPQAAVQALTLVGGGARSSLWAGLLATVLGVRIHTCEGAHAGAALGAARLASLACGASITDVCSQPAVIAEYVPDDGAADWLRLRYARFGALYTVLREEFERAER